MGSKTKTSKSNNKKTSGYQGIIGPQREISAPLGMGPGQSMAMAGNTGLASATPAQARQIQQGLKNLGQPSSFQAIGQNIGEVGSKYRRPADIASYAEKMQQLNRALDAGGNIFTGPDEIERVNLAGTGIKDEQGRTILSMMTPELTATAPTIGQLGGDIARAVTGYNTLEYTDPQTNVPSMVRKKGLADLLMKAAIPGQLAFSIAKDLFGKYFPGQEEDDTQPIVDLRKPVIEERVSTYIGQDPYVEKRNTLKQLIAQSQAPGASELNVDTMTDREVDLRLQSYGQGFAMGGLTDTIPPDRGPMSEGVASLFKNK